MRFLKWSAVALLALAAVLFGGGMLLSGKFSVVRSTVVNAPPDKVYGLLADPRRWKEWSAWNQRDPAMQITYSGPPSGSGAVWAWKSASQGDGRMTFTTAEPARRLGYELYFPDFGTTSTGDFALQASGTGTKVSWTMNGDMGSNPLFHWFALMSDRMVGKDFDEGLANLKALSEKP